MKGSSQRPIHFLPLVPYWLIVIYSAFHFLTVDDPSWGLRLCHWKNPENIMGIIVALAGSIAMNLSYLRVMDKAALQNAGKGRAVRLFDTGARVSVLLIGLVFTVLLMILNGCDVCDRRGSHCRMEIPTSKTQGF